MAGKYQIIEAFELFIHALKEKERGENGCFVWEASEFFSWLKGFRRLSNPCPFLRRLIEIRLEKSHLKGSYFLWSQVLLEETPYIYITARFCSHIYYVLWQPDTETLIILPVEAGFLVKDLFEEGLLSKLFTYAYDRRKVRVYFEKWQRIYYGLD